MDVSETELV